ncbi:hypothetical protein GCM10009858_46830 [Terrabacter carboxydivorans]|uniref:Uncharacterized protein n=1 Tax=Terrabacter carboxydivorans TaxID=619730 RepID=A0ABP5ZS30_9MICO
MWARCNLIGTHHGRHAGSGVPRWSLDGTRLLVGSFSDLELRPAIVVPDGTDLNVLPVPGLPPTTALMCAAVGSAERCQDPLFIFAMSPQA